MTKPIFKNEKLQAEFDRDGFVVVRNMMSARQIKHVHDLYVSLGKKHFGDKLGMHSSSHTSNAEMLETIYKELREVIQDDVDKHMCNYKFYMANYLVKESREDSLFDWHQDWNVVDESQYCSWNVWMDVQGTNSSNGHMFFVKGSHRITPTLRFSPKCPTPFEKIKNIMPYFYTYLDTKAGDVVFLNNACIHGSTVNNSGKIRIAAVLGAYSADADLLHYFLEPGQPLTKIEKRKITTESLIHMPRGERPPFSDFVEYVSYNPRQIEPEEFTQFMAKNSSIKERAKFFFRQLHFS